MPTTSLPTTSVLAPSYLIHSSLQPSPTCFFHQHLAWQHFLHLLQLHHQDVDTFLSSQRLQFIPGNSLGLLPGIGFRLGGGGLVAICDISSVAEAMGHDEGWVQHQVRRGGVWRREEAGGEVKAQGRSGEMEEVGQDGGQQTAGGTESGNEGETRSFPNSNQTRFPASQQQAPKIKAFGTPAGSEVPLFSATSTSDQQQAPTHGALRSSTGPGLPFPSLPPGLPLETSSMGVQQQAASNGAFGSFANASTSFPNAPQQSTISSVPNDAATPGTYMGPDGRVRKMPKGLRRTSPDN